MIEQRVSLIEGKTPFLLIAPSGPNDPKTDLLTEILASKLNGYAVINWGWERSPKIDYLKDKADCNDIDQCKSIVYDEFLEPILKFKNRIIKNHRKVHQFVIQGISGNDLPSSIDIVVGAGSSARPSCAEWAKEIFLYMSAVEGIKAYLAKSGTILSGSLKKHLNQLFSYDNSVQSMQIEIPLTFRKTNEDLNVFTNEIYKVMQHLLTMDEIQAKAIIPSNFRPKIY